MVNDQVSFNAKALKVWKHRQETCDKALNTFSHCLFDYIENLP